MYSNPAITRFDRMSANHSLPWYDATLTKVAILDTKSKRIAASGHEEVLLVVVIFSGTCILSIMEPPI